MRWKTSLLMDEMRLSRCLIDFSILCLLDDGTVADRNVVLLDVACGRCSSFLCTLSRLRDQGSMLCFASVVILPNEPLRLE
jgi:hypothetical protein